MDKIFVTVKDGYAKILNERGNYEGNHLAGSDWVSAQVNGDQIMATKKDGTTQFFDKKGNYRNHA